MLNLASWLLHSFYYLTEILYGVAAFKLLFIALLFLVFLVYKGAGLIRAAAGKSTGSNPKE